MAGLLGHGSGGLSLDSGASVDNQPGGCFGFISSASISADGSAASFLNEGTLCYDPADSGYSPINPVFLNTGSVTVVQGALGFIEATNSWRVTVTPGAVLSASTYSQTAGATALDGGTFNGGIFSLIAGSLTGTGTINAETCCSNGGQVIPGGTGATGTFTINGSYTQTATGSLDINLGGTTDGASRSARRLGHDRADGTLNVALIHDFQPAVGNTFQVLTFGSFWAISRLTTV